MSKHPIIANRTAFLVIGCLEAAWAPLVPYVKRAFSLDEASLGLLMLCTGLGSIIALPLSSWLCVRFGAKRVVYFSGFLMAFSLLTISLLANFTLTAIMLLVCGGCTITIDVAANVNGVAVEGQTGKHLMSGFHGGYSLGTLIGAGVMSSLFAFGIIPMWSVVIFMILVLAAMMAGCRDLLSSKVLKSNDHPKQDVNKKFYIPPMVIVVGVLCFIMYASEGAVMGWSAMTIMRLCGDKIVDRFGRRTVISGGALLISAGFLIVVSIDSAIASVAGFAMVGCGAANVVPQLVSFAAHIKGMAVHNIISFINALGYSGILLGPVIIGFIGKRYGLHVSFIGIAVFALIVAIISSIILRSKQITLQVDLQNERETCSL